MTFSALPLDSFACVLLAFVWCSRWRGRRHIVLRLRGSETQSFFEKTYHDLKADLQALESSGAADVITSTGVGATTAPTHAPGGGGSKSAPLVLRMRYQPLRCPARWVIPPSTPESVAKQTRANYRVWRIDELRWMIGLYQSVRATQPQSSASDVEEGGVSDPNIDWRWPDHDTKTQALSAVIDVCGTASGGSGGGLPDELCRLINEYCDYRITPPVLTAKEEEAGFEIRTLTSDVRLKSNVTTLSTIPIPLTATATPTASGGGGGGAPKLLRTVRWEWNELAARHFAGLSGAAEGVIAQEVAELYPRAVFADPQTGYYQIDARTLFQWLKTECGITSL